MPTPSVLTSSANTAAPTEQATGTTYATAAATDEAAHLLSEASDSSKRPPDVLNDASVEPPRKSPSPNVERRGDERRRVDKKGVTPP